MADDFDDIDDLELDNITSIDEARLRKLKHKGNYYTMLERFELLRIKFIYDTLDKEEAVNFVTLLKYFKEFGHSESFRLSCFYLYKKYVKGKGI
jgi:hypothetical protein